MWAVARNVDRNEKREKEPLCEDLWSRIETESAVSLILVFDSVLNVNRFSKGPRLTMSSLRKWKKKCAWIETLMSQSQLHSHILTTFFFLAAVIHARVCWTYKGLFLRPRNSMKSWMSMNWLVTKLCPRMARMQFTVITVTDIPLEILNYFLNESLISDKGRQKQDSLFYSIFTNSISCSLLDCLANISPISWSLAGLILQPESHSHKYMFECYIMLKDWC